MPVSRRSLLTALAAAPLAHAAPGPDVSIRGEQFLLNGKPTYAGRTFEGMKIEGLLFNSRMIQGVFDDENPATSSRWNYPDTGKWDADRNTREFIAAMPEWRRHGVLSFTLGLQGGSPQGYSQDQPWRNSAFTSNGALKPAYRTRLRLILDRAAALGMAPMLNYFYFGQDERLDGDAAVLRATRETTEWILQRGYRNVMVDVVNEANNRKYEQPLMKAARVHELIRLVQSLSSGGRRLLAGASFNGNTLPTPEVAAASDFVLLHGNGVRDPARITEMVSQVRSMSSWKPKPIVFNEDDHFDFDRPANNMRSATAAYASWGYFDPGASDYNDGYQCPPVNWGLSTPRKRAFFSTVKRYTGF